MLAVNATDISRSFKNSVLKNLSLQVEEGSLLVIHGENGSGKTTLLRLLATLIEPDAGDAKIFGASVKLEPKKARGHLAWCPASDSGFLPRLTGLQNLYFFSGLRGISAETAQKRISQHHQFAPLQKALETPFYLCSSGMKQSLMLARALIAMPKLLLLDEPLRSLDEHGRAQTMEFLENAKVTCILTSHHHAELKSKKAKFAELREGKILC